MSTALDLDLATLVGELPAVPCEHHQHAELLTMGWPSHVDEPASHYIRSFCECGYVGEMRAVCPAYVAFALTDSPSRCVSCKAVGPANQHIQILGPVNGRSS